MKRPKQTHAAKRDRRNAQAWLERNGEAAKEYNRAQAALSRARKRANKAAEVLRSQKGDVPALAPTSDERPE